MDATPKPNHQIPTLSPDDARVLDALMAAHCGQPTPALSPADAPRAEKLTRLLSVISRSPASAPPLDLGQRTLARLAELRREELQAVAMEAPTHPINVRWAELATVAAIVVIGFSLLVPVLWRLRDDARRVACIDNLGEAGTALATYANDFDDTMPRRATAPSGVWWNVGKDARVASADAPVESNSANLYELIRAGYVNPNVLNCPANADAIRDLPPGRSDWPSAQAVSYSYQNQAGPYGLRIDRYPNMALMADKNPLFVVDPSKRYGLTYNATLDPNAASPLHGRQGQSILTADGHTFWSRSPVLSNGDNIWLANGVDRYTGTEPPSSPDDSFLVP